MKPRIYQRFGIWWCHLPRKGYVGTGRTAALAYFDWEANYIEVKWFSPHGLV